MDGPDNDPVEQITLYGDGDKDGYGLSVPTMTGCIPEEGWAYTADDCDDLDPDEHPGQVWYWDTDGDGYGAGQGTESCVRPSEDDEWVIFGNDCADGNMSINPGKVEICFDNGAAEGVDNDCANGVDDGCPQLFCPMGNGVVNQDYTVDPNTNGYLVNCNIQVQGDLDPQFYISDGVTLFFMDGLGLYIGPQNFSEYGELVIDGNDLGVVMTGWTEADEDPLEPGAWKGIQVGHRARASEIEGLDISYGGGFGGAIVVEGDDTELYISNSTISLSSGYGVEILEGTVRLEDNIIENNIIVDGKASQLQLAPIDSLTSGRTKGHPDTSMWLMTGTVIRRNILSYDASSARYMRGRKYEQCIAECDRNLFWPGKGEIRMQVKPAEGETQWEAWRKLGYDRNSVIADPRFAAPEKDDYRLRKDSPAFALGFKPIPVGKIGLYAADERASWPVPDDCWRETHLTHPGGLSDRHITASPSRSARKVIPTLTALPVPKPPVLDGTVSAREYPGEAVPVRELSMADGQGKLPAQLRVAYDAKCLYVGLVSTVSNAPKLSRKGGTWGRDDGAEVCVQLMGDYRPVFVIQGFPSGAFASVPDAGAPADKVSELGKAVRYAARIQGSRWSGEWSIPWYKINSDGPPKQLRFNVGLLKGAEKQWVAWTSTGAAPWNLDRAGILKLKGK